MTLIYPLPLQRGQIIFFVIFFFLSILKFSFFTLQIVEVNQIDLFKLNNWDNRSRSCSLKWIQFSLDWDNLLDMPIDHKASIKTKEEIEKIRPGINAFMGA